eukprot:2127416-Ditylum_brightwellii.AAC.1
MKEAGMLIDYLATYPNTCLRFFAGSMQLHVDSNATYIFQPRAKHRYTGHFYLASHPSPINYNKVPNNVSILTECKTLKNIICSAAEAECSILFRNSQKAMGIK